MWKRLLKWFRIAVTAVSLLVCGLLNVLWVRSYSCPEFFAVWPTDELLISADSIQGTTYLKIETPWCGPRNPWSWEVITLSEEELSRASKRWEFDAYDRYAHSWPNFWWYSIRVPYWFLVTIAATVATLPWIKWRFSLRTLLTVLTMFAVFFGMIAMSMGAN